MEAIREQSSVSNVNFTRNDQVEPSRRAVQENVHHVDLAVTRPKKATEGGHTDVDYTPENEQKIKTAISALEALKEHHPETTFKYSVHDSGKIQVELRNFKTGELVEAIPSSKILEFRKSLEELTGLVLEKRA